jgi:hypothetical protein
MTEEPPRRPQNVPIMRRVAAGFAWWVVLMAFWVVLDYSIRLDELLAGAGAAALGALLAELATSRAGARFRVRARWLVQAAALPVQVTRDTVIVFAALWRRVARGQEPASGFRELPARYGPGTADGLTRRVLLIAGRSVAPNSFALGIDEARNVMITHQLVANEGKAAE